MQALLPISALIGNTPAIQFAGVCLILLTRIEASGAGPVSPGCGARALWEVVKSWRVVYVCPFSDPKCYPLSLPSDSCDGHVTHVPAEAKKLGGEVHFKVGEGRQVALNQRLKNGNTVKTQVRFMCAGRKLQCFFLKHLHVSNMLWCCMSLHLSSILFGSGALSDGRRMPRRIS